MYREFSNSVARRPNEPVFAYDRFGKSFIGGRLLDNTLREISSSPLDLGLDIVYELAYLEFRAFVKLIYGYYAPETKGLVVARY